MTESLNIIILAAGKGKRMCSDLPKVLHLLAGKPLLAHCYETARMLAPRRVQIVYGHGGEQVRACLAEFDVVWVEQQQQLGTGHAVRQALPEVRDNDKVVVLYGDVPLLTHDTLKSLIDDVNDSTLALLTVVLEDPTGYGRIIRNEHGKVLRIVEEKDATQEEKRVSEVNTGILSVKGKLLAQWLTRLKANNAQGEYYLTDIVAMAVADGVTIATQSPTTRMEVMGVNDKVQLAYLERAYQKQRAEELMRGGVTLCDPNRVDLRGSLKTGTDVIIDVNVIFEGRVTLGNQVTIGPHCVIKDAVIGDGVKIQAFSHIDTAHIGQDSVIGPFARIRPDTQLDSGVHIGNFVEIKKSSVGAQSKINHLSYIGDCTVGREVNIGAGTITCNYDGANKHTTVIEDQVFIGSDTQLVAPVRIKKGATIGAGSTITKDAPEDELTLSRSKQTTVEGWIRPVKKPK